MSPDSRRHRGPHPKDAELFAPDQIERLRTATAELSWLLTRGYAAESAVKLVGDGHKLRARQRLAVSRAACSDQQKELRLRACVAAEALAGRRLVIDGLNLLITIEAALSGGLILKCRDGCFRDLSSVHGSYRGVVETRGALLLVGEFVSAHQPSSTVWLLDRPVSNSGRLAEIIRKTAAEREWNWEAEVVIDPDAAMAASHDLAATSDSGVLDRLQSWVNLARAIVTAHAYEAWTIDLAV